MTNLYWPIYKNIEREVLELANKIHFDDDQLSVYSVKISELLIRCVVEVEAIAKELYIQNEGTIPDNRDLYFDTDCLNLLEEKWKLSKKQVVVSSANFYFQKIENKILNPLNKANKRGTSAADWEKAYQAVKHNRTKNLSKGNIKHLLRATAGLFLLNLYYRNDVFDLAKNNNTSFVDSLSGLFNVKVHIWRGENNTEDSYVKHDDFEECTYLIKWTNDYKNKWSDFAYEQNKNLNEILFNHPKIKKYIEENLIENDKIKQEEYSKFIENREYFKLIDLKTEYANMINAAAQKTKQKLNFDWHTPQEYEAILNKDEQIYPTKK